MELSALKCFSHRTASWGWSKVPSFLEERGVEDLWVHENTEEQDTYMYLKYTYWAIMLNTVLLGGYINHTWLTVTEHKHKMVVVWKKKLLQWQEHQ